MRAIKGYKDEWRIQEYLLITFFISWLAWGLLVLLTVLGAITLMSPLGIILFVLGGFGPTISAIMCIEGNITTKSVFKFIFTHQKKTFWVFGLFALLIIAVVALSSMELNPAEPWYLLPILLIITTLVGGGNEELGWRGTLQPTLERIIARRVKNKTLAFCLTMVLIGAVWGLWHLPLWFVTGSTHQAMPFALFILMAVLLSFYLGYIYRRTGSVLYCMIFHGLANVMLSAFIIKINWILIVGLLVMLILAIVLPKPKLASEKEGNS